MFYFVLGFIEFANLITIETHQGTFKHSKKIIRKIEQ